MHKAFVRRIERRLLAMRREIQRRIIEQGLEIGAIARTGDTQDAMDQATYNVDRAAMEALATLDLKRLQLVEAALLRIREGRYGICMKTGKPISRERLEAIPYALYGVEAQRALDHRGDSGLEERPRREGCFRHVSFGDFTKVAEAFSKGWSWGSGQGALRLADRVFEPPRMRRGDDAVLSSRARRCRGRGRV